jgi:hypothetical protein
VASACYIGTLRAAAAAAACGGWNIVHHVAMTMVDVMHAGLLLLQEWAGVPALLLLLAHIPAQLQMAPQHMERLLLFCNYLHMNSIMHHLEPLGCYTVPAA